MNIGIIGYGKMGREIEKIALEKGHQIKFKIDSKNKHRLTKIALSKIDVALEFSDPNSAFSNISLCIKNGTPVVCGTTGWLQKMKQAESLCIKHNSTLLYAANFSVGLNMFLKINKIFTKIIEKTNYKIEVTEKHHKTKKDKPSGTAIMIANQILEQRNDNFYPPIISKRIGNCKGEHIVNCYSEIDSIRLSHTAHSRIGFAKGAILAAEFVEKKKGVFSMEDVINNL